MAWRHYLPAMLCAAVILIASGIPGNYLPEIKSFRDWLGPDKILHLFLFGTFQYFFIYCYFRSHRENVLSVPIILLLLLIGMLFGIFTEILQRYLFTGRSANAYDAAADAIGCMAGLGFFFLILKKRTKTS